MSFFSATFFNPAFFNTGDAVVDTPDYEIPALYGLQSFTAIYGLDLVSGSFGLTAITATWKEAG